jgi:D-3-phosphoglycerate dehydrogenase
MIEGHGPVHVKVPFVSLAEILSSCDFVSLHVPKQANGAAVIGKEELASCKKGIILVNTSRGGVIEESALIEALDNGQVAFAALDVFVGEPKPNAAILKHPKILSTPHIGASTNEAQERIGLEIASRVQDIMKINA